MDRGGDRDKLFFPLIKNKTKFLIRLNLGRHLIYQGRALDDLEIARLSSACGRSRFPDVRSR